MKHNATWQYGARQGMVPAWSGPLVCPLPRAGCGPRTPSGWDGALIQGKNKIVTGHQGGSGFWSGPVHPNGLGHSLRPQAFMHESPFPDYTVDTRPSAIRLYSARGYMLVRSF